MIRYAVAGLFALTVVLSFVTCFFIAQCRSLRSDVEALKARESSRIGEIAKLEASVFESRHKCNLLADRVWKLESQQESTRQPEKSRLEELDLPK